MSEIAEEKKRSALSRLFFSDLIAGKSASKKAAYLGVLTALCIVANMFLEFKFADVQFSVTLYISMLTGMIAGPVYGFCAVFLGDLLGFLYNSWGYIYMPWVGLSVATTAFITGLVMNIRIPVKGSGYIKLAICCILTFFVCTVGISSTGFYFYNKAMGFSTAVLEYVESRFGGRVGYFGYCCYRLIFKGQIFNSLFNYALIFMSVPILNGVKALGITIK